MISTLDYGKELASNEQLSSDSRQEVSKDVKYLDERWKAVLKESQDEYARYIYVDALHASFSLRPRKWGYFVAAAMNPSTISRCAHTKTYFAS